MTNLAKRTSLVKESPTLAITARATSMKKSGIDVITLSAGEPDFDTPDYIKKAAIKAIHDGKTKYTPNSGTAELKEAIINKFSRENNFNYEPSQVIVSSGGKHSIYNVIMALINEGDEAIIPAPYWVSYPDMILLAGGKPICITCPKEDDYKLTPDKLKQAINSKTKLLFLNSPSNPTGQVYTKEELTAIANVLNDYPNVYVITDDIYEHIRFTKDNFYNILNVAPELGNRIIVVNGVSKAYSMTGWRIGYAACHDQTVIKAMDKIQSQATSNPCSISQAAAAAGLNGGIDSVNTMLVEFNKRREYVTTTLNSLEGISCPQIDGAFYAFFDCSHAINNLSQQGKISEQTDLALANYWLENVNVALVPGSAFGLEKHMRLSFATSMENLTNALERIKQTL